uniref:Palladin n=1 Tax=Aceria tosichella TaxID=561515 RepID=A0A6G1SCT1_9ACAR
MAAERQPSGASDEGAGVNDRANNASSRAVPSSASSKLLETKTTKIITTTTIETNDNASEQICNRRAAAGFDGPPEVAKVEHLGRQANTNESQEVGAATRGPRARRQEQLSSRTTKRADNNSNSNNNSNTTTNFSTSATVKDYSDSNSVLEPIELEQVNVEGNKFVTSVGTIAVQSGQSRIVAALLRDGCELQLRVQEMRPGIFEVGANLSECRRFHAEHQKLLANLAKHKQAPIEGWLAKYKKVSQSRGGAEKMGAELRLVYMCMAENLQGCWRGLLLQLEQRLQLLDETGKFYSSAEQLFQAIERADGHVQTFRREFLDGPGSVRFNQAANELRRLNQAVLDEFERARRQQRRLVDLIGKIATANLADSRPNILIADAQVLIDFINGYIDPLERRKIQLENVISTTARETTLTTTRTTRNINDSRLATDRSGYSNNKMNPTTIGPQQTQARPLQADNQQEGERGWSSSSATTTTTTLATSGAGGGPLIREISSFNDLHLVDSWLTTKVDQLNSSLLSSLGASAQDTRSILNKHEQIALECSAIEEALLMFRGKSIHAMKSGPEAAEAGQEPSAAASAGPTSTSEPGQGPPAAGGGRRASLLEQQRQLAQKARDVINILDARIVLLRRTIDFYSRAKEASADINKMMRRLQADNSLQSVQFVADELELKDVSSVVASGATIISELQQLQLAQQHGQRSKVVGLQLATGGIRAVVDQLNQELAHLKTVLNQRRLVLLNEDASKMASNFTNKCRQLKFWLDSHARSFLLSNNRIGVDVRSVRAYCDQHDELRLAVQQKTLEVEALLRLLSNLTESFDAKSQTANEIQRDTDELRQDWISVTNCLDHRLELARKYLAILVSVAEVRADIEALGDVGGAGPTTGDSQGPQPRPRTPDERTHEDIEAHVGQSLVQLANQVRNFTQDAQKSNTALVYAAALETKSALNDINKQQIIGHANGSVKLLEEQLKTTLNRLKARGPRKWPEEAPVTSSAPPSSGQRATTKRTEHHRRVETVRQQQQQQQNITGLQAPQPPPPRAPRFVRQLVDAEVEPFSSVALECELEPEPEQPSPRVEWLLNNKRIPNSIKHSVASEGNRHRLTIGQFSPVCCGTYTARATNPMGVSTTSSCRLRLSGIREDESPTNPSSQPMSSAEPPVPTFGRGDAAGSHRKDDQRQLGDTPVMMTSGPYTGARPGQWRPVAGSNKWQQQVSKERALERIIQGVESPMSHDEQMNEPNLSSAAPTRASQQRQTTEASSLTRTTTATSTITTTATGQQQQQQQQLQNQQLPVTKVRYDGSQQQPPTANYLGVSAAARQRLSFIDSPVSSAQSRSVSGSPFEGTPQPPVFMQALSEQTLPSSRAGNIGGTQAGLVCVVIGNPPPNVEWLHEGRPIASAKCPRPGGNGSQSQRANVCKLTIETVNDRTLGQYVCRATNRLGQSTTALTLGQ